MTLDYRVGHAATTELERLCEETIRAAWQAKDYETLIDYSAKHRMLAAYNSSTGEKLFK